jgi:hypothetical protein
MGAVPYIGGSFVKFDSRLLLIPAILTLGWGSQILRADTIDFSYTVPILGSPGEDVTATGVLIATPLPNPLFPDQYLVTGISGTRTVDGVTEAITGLLAPGTFPMGSHPNDNHVRLAFAPYLSFNGLGFTVAGAGDDGSGDVDIYYAPGPQGYFEASSLYGAGTFSGTLVVPEPVPPTLAVLALFGAVGWWRKKHLA